MGKNCKVNAQIILSTQCGMIQEAQDTEDGKGVLDIEYNSGLIERKTYMMVIQSTLEKDQR